MENSTLIPYIVMRAVFICIYFLSRLAGSLALTYNGINSSTTISVGNVSSSSLSFNIRTRQSNGFLLSSDLNATDRFIAIVIIDEVLTVIAQESNKTFRINGKLFYIALNDADFRYRN